MEKQQQSELLTNIGETEHHIVQSVSPLTAVAHLKHLVESAPAINQNVAISYPPSSIPAMASSMWKPNHR